MPSGTLASPIGTILVTADADRVTALRIGADAPTGELSSPLIAEALAQLDAFFAGRLSRFDLPLLPAASLRGAHLRKAIASIPAGETMSYGAVARLAGSSPRAVGQACARNPFPLLVPCHRVLGAGNALGQYSAGSGVATKRWLLAHERRDDRHG